MWLSIPSSSSVRQYSFSGFMINWLVIVRGHVLWCSQMPDAKVTLQIDGEAWKKFRVACLEQEVVAGRAIENYIRWQLAQWAKETK